jgi:hypothetical protein
MRQLFFTPRSNNGNQDSHAVTTGLPPQAMHAVSAEDGKIFETEESGRSRIRPRSLDWQYAAAEGRQ